ncbi:MULTISPECIES: GNAT family N-acetyltransferase [unclassified Microcoleus]|uniref:GNAT family N-acetyltransferase n=1 Tax=unclassified Microcoleus TaxID=2642155 RepID=UPI002FD3B53B
MSSVTEAAFAILEYGFQTLELDRIVAVSKSENIASRWVMAKVGMQYKQKVGCWGANSIQSGLNRGESRSIE